MKIEKLLMKIEKLEITDMYLKLICGLTGQVDLEKLQEQVNALYQQGYMPEKMSSGEKDKKHELCILMLKHP